jgi:hypothetical protein
MKIKSIERGRAVKEIFLARTLIPTSVQADNEAGLTEGIIGLANKG